MISVIKKFFSNIKLYFYVIVISYVVYLYIKNKHNEKKIDKLYEDLKKLVSENRELVELNNRNVKKALSIIKEHKKISNMNEETKDDANEASSEHSNIYNDIKNNDKGGNRID